MSNKFLLTDDSNSATNPLQEDLEANGHSVKGVNQLCLLSLSGNEICLSAEDSLTPGYDILFPNIPGTPGDVLELTADGETLEWIPLSGGGGFIQSSVTPVIDRRLPVYDGVSGQFVTETSVTIDGSDNMAGILSLTATNITGSTDISTPILTLTGTTTDTNITRPDSTGATHTLELPGALLGADQLLQFTSIGIGSFVLRSTFMNNPATADLDMDSNDITDVNVILTTELDIENGAFSTQISRNAAGASYALNMPDAAPLNNSILTSSFGGQLRWETGVLFNPATANLDMDGFDILDVLNITNTGDLTITSDSANIDGLTIEHTNALGGMLITTAGDTGMTLSCTGTGNFTVNSTSITGIASLTANATTWRLYNPTAKAQVRSDEAAVDAVHLLADDVAGGLTADTGTGGHNISSTGDIALVTTSTDADSILLDTDGGIQLMAEFPLLLQGSLNSGINDIDINATGASGKILNTAAEWGATLTGSAVDAFDLNVPAGGVQITTSSNIDLNGTLINSSGDIDMNASDITNAGLVSLEETGAGTDTITLQAPAIIASSYTLTLPIDDGNIDDIITSNGSGVLSFVENPYPPGYLDSLNVQWNSVIQVQIVSGTCRDDADSFNLTLSGTTTITITTVGAGGLQTSSSEAGDTWYKCLVIGDTTGVNATTTLLVPQGTAFSESGYDVFRLVGHVRNSSASNFIRFTMHGESRSRHVTQEDTRTLLTMFDGFHSGGDDTFQTLDISAFVPDNTSRIDMQYVFDMDADGDKLYLSSGINNQTIPGEVLQILGLGISTAAFNELDSIVYNLALDPTGPSFDWGVSDSGDPGNEVVFVLNAYIQNI